MKHLFSKLIILIFSLTDIIDLYSQQKPYNIELSKCYGGSREDNGGVGSRQRPILSTPDGGAIFVAITNSKDGDIDKSKRQNDMFQQDSFINDDIWIVKLARDNTIEWEQYFGGEGTDFVTDMKVTSDGGYILCGSTSSFKGDFPMDTTGIFDILAHGGFPDCFLMKLDSVGKKQWVTRVGGSSSDYLSSVIQTSEGGYVAVGQSYSTDESWLGFSWIRHPGPWPDALVIKIGVDGSKLWSKLYGGTKLDGFLSVKEQSNGSFIMCGATESDDGDISKIHYKDSVNSIGLIDDVWVVEISNTGTIIRDKCFGGSDSEGSSQLLSTNDGGYIIIGTTSPGNPPARFRTGDVLGYHPEKKGLTYGPNDSWIFKIDTSWNIVWQNCIGGSQQDVITSLTPTHSGGYAFIGYTNSSDSDLTGIHNPLPEHNWDIWAGELSSTGKLLRHQCFGGTGNDYGNGIVENPDGELTLYASVGSMDGDIVGHHGGIYPHFSDIWVAKLKQAPSGVEAVAGGSHFANPYPNPSTNEMNLYIRPTEPVERVQFFNPIGQEFFPEYEISGNLLTTKTATLHDGIYIIRITYKNLAVQEVRKFIKSK